MKRVILVLAAMAMATGAAWAAPILVTDVTMPGDPIIGTSNNYPGGTNPEGPAGNEAPKSAIDNVVNVEGRSKYLNFDKIDSGFIVTPTIGLSLLNGIALTTANDSPERDPFSVTIYGTNNLSPLPSDGDDLAPGDWTLLVANLDTSSLSSDRWAESVFSFNEVDWFARYKVIFPTVRDEGTANSMQIGEVRLIGLVPEPASLALLGLGSLVALRRRR